MLFLLNMVEYVKSTLWNKQQITSNAEHFKETSWKH